MMSRRQVGIVKQVNVLGERLRMAAGMNNNTSVADVAGWRVLALAGVRLKSRATRVSVVFPAI